MWREKDFEMASQHIGHFPFHHPPFFLCILVLLLTWTYFLLSQLLWDFGISSNLSIILASSFESPYLLPWVRCPETSVFFFCGSYSLASVRAFIVLFSLLWISYKQMDVSSHWVYGFVCSTLMHSCPERDQWEPNWQPLTDPFVCIIPGWAVIH